MTLQGWLSPAVDTRARRDIRALCRHLREVVKPQPGQLVHEATLRCLQQLTQPSFQRLTQPRMTSTVLCSCISLQNKLAVGTASKLTAVICHEEQMGWTTHMTVGIRFPTDFSYRTKQRQQPHRDAERAHTCSAHTCVCVCALAGQDVNTGLWSDLHGLAPLSTPPSTGWHRRQGPLIQCTVLRYVTAHVLLCLMPWGGQAVAFAFQLRGKRCTQQTQADKRRSQKVGTRFVMLA